MSRPPFKALPLSSCCHFWDQDPTVLNINTSAAVHLGPAILGSNLIPHSNHHSPGFSLEDGDPLRHLCIALSPWMICVSRLLGYACHCFPREECEATVLGSCRHHDSPTNSRPSKLLQKNQRYLNNPPRPCLLGVLPLAQTGRYLHPTGF